MHPRPHKTLNAITTAALLAAVGGVPAFAADHLDAPALHPNGQADINDLYAFQSLEDANNSVFIMTVNPFAGVMNPTGNTSPTTFGTDITYNLNIDNNGDAIADLVYSTTFSADVAGVQGYTTVLNGSTAYATGSTGGTSATTSGGRINAGNFDDPFFFDLNGFNDGLNFTGDDTFAGASVSAIVLEVANSELAGPNIAVWATTTDTATGDQIDRMGRPAINTVLIPSARKDEFNQADPTMDFADFGADVQSAIEGLNGGDAGHASAVTGVLLPDVLTFDTSDPSGFLNGRRLEDDVIDAELTLLTNSSTPIGDGVDANDVPFLDVFPYLAPVPEPGSLALLGLGGLVLLRRRR